MPPRASVQHVKDDELVDEQEVTLDLLVESIGEVHAASVAGAWLGPLSAHCSSVDHFWNEIKYSVGNSNVL